MQINCQQEVSWVNTNITYKFNTYVTANSCRNKKKQGNSAFLSYKHVILHKQTMPNNRERSPDCGDICFRSKSEEMSLKRSKYTQKTRNYMCKIRWWWFRITRQSGHVICLQARNDNCCDHVINVRNYFWEDLNIFVFICSNFHIYSWTSYIRVFVLICSIYIVRCITEFRWCLHLFVPMSLYGFGLTIYSNWHNNAYEHLETILTPSIEYLFIIRYLARLTLYLSQLSIYWN